VNKGKRFTPINLSMFNKLFVSFMLTIVIPTAIISFLNFRAFSVELEDRNQSAYKDNLRYMTGQLELMLEGIKTFSLQLSLNSDINEVMTRGDASVYQYNLIKRHMKNQMAANDMFYSMYLYIQVNDMVLTTNEGLLKRADFYDKGILDQLLKSNGLTSIQQFRSLQDYSTADPNEVFTFTYSVPPLNSYPLGQLVINVKKDSLIKAMQADRLRGGHMLIVDADHQVIYKDFADGQLAGVDLGAIAAHSQKQAQLVNITGESFYVSASRLEAPEWTLIRLDPQAAYAGKLRDKLAGIVTLDLIVLLAGLLLSYLLSSYMYAPWKKISDGLAGYFKPSGKPAESSEPVWVANAIHHLITENHSFQETIRRNEPIIRDRFVYDILNKNYAPKLNVLETMKDMGIRFTSPLFLVMICSSDTRECDDGDLYDHKLLMLSYIKSRFGESFPTAGTVLELSELGFIVNLSEPGLTDEVKEKLSRCCGDVLDWAQRELGLTLQFTFGDVCRSIVKVNESYEQARRMLSYKPVIDKADIVFYSNVTSHNGFTYPMSVQKQLLYSIASKQLDAALTCIDELFESYIYNQSYPRESLHEMIVLLTSAIKNKLLEDGFELDSLRKHISASQIFACSNNHELYEMMVQYIQEHYMEPISISDIAGRLGLSSSYLSRFFKSETGKSPLEYLTEYRIDKSKELLQTSEYTLQQISERIGYPDVNSFIRYFKKHEGVTPGKYRNNAILTV
jgi:two-component system response regulator YesN